MTATVSRYITPAIIIDPLPAPNTNELTGLDLTPNDKAAIAGMVKRLVRSFSAEQQPKYCTIRFSEGLLNALSAAQNGDTSAILRDPKTGKNISYAEAQEAASAVQITNALTVMAIATNQSYLDEIRDKFELIAGKLDRIRESLYGDPKFELLSEISFSRYAYENYYAISKCEPQTTAVIGSLQEGRKAAIKDTELYFAELDTIAECFIPGESDKSAERELQIRKSIGMAVQLYAVNCLLEAYYSRSADHGYIGYLVNDIAALIERCDGRMPQGRKTGEKYEDLLSALEVVTWNIEYVVSDAGEVYLSEIID